MERRRNPVNQITIQPELHCSIDDQRRLLGESPFFSSLSPEEVVEVQRSFRQQHYNADEPIQMAGDRADRLSIVAAGMVKMVRPTLDGQDVLLDFLRPGEHFGSLAKLGDEAYREDVTAQTPVCVLYTTADGFQELLQRYPAVALSTLEMVAGRLRTAQSVIEQLSAYPVEHRVAATLLHLADKSGREKDGHTLIDMPLSRQDIADMTGAKVETVSRVMSEFRRGGLIDGGRRWISVLDRAGLSRLIDEALA